MDFGTESNPLRASQLPMLVLCGWRAWAKELALTTDESGKAADTGSAVHLAVSTWHTNKKDRVAAVEAMRAASAAFPLAELDEVERIFGRYADDPRNQNAEVLAVEQKVRLRLDPKYVDCGPIWIKGTLDQIRRNPYTGAPEVFDLKTGNRDGLYFQNAYALQLAAYTLAARETFPGAVAGGYIRTKGYFTRGAALPDPHGVFIPACVPDPDKLLDAVRWAVCALRSGYVVATPGTHCETCFFQGVENCLPKLATVTE